MFTLCVCVCVCVRERERKRERQTERDRERERERESERERARERQRERQRENYQTQNFQDFDNVEPYAIVKISRTQFLDRVHIVLCGDRSILLRCFSIY